MTGGKRDLLWSGMLALVALYIGFMAAAQVLPRPWVLAYVGVIQLGVAGIVVWVIVVFLRNRR